MKANCMQNEVKLTAVKLNRVKLSTNKPICANCKQTKEITYRVCNTVLTALVQYMKLNINVG